jgi:hypothetical protein
MYSKYIGLEPHLKVRNKDAMLELITLKSHHTQFIITTQSETPPGNDTLPARVKLRSLDERIVIIYEIGARAN